MLNFPSISSLFFYSSISVLLAIFWNCHSLPCSTTLFHPITFLSQHWSSIFSLPCLWFTVWIRWLNLKSRILIPIWLGAWQPFPQVTHDQDSLPRRVYVMNLVNCTMFRLSLNMVNWNYNPWYCSLAKNPTHTIWQKKYQFPTSYSHQTELRLVLNHIKSWFPHCLNEIKRI